MSARGMNPGSPHSTQQRTEAMALYHQVGPAEAGRRTGIPANTISAWAHRSGASTICRERTEAAARQHAMSRHERKQRLADDLLRDAEHLRRKIWETLRVTHVTQRGDVVTIDELPEPSEIRSLLSAIGTAIDKSQLLAGEATSRAEVSLEDARRTVTDMRDDLAERRRRRELSAR